MKSFTSCIKFGQAVLTLFTILAVTANSFQVITLKEGK